MSRTVLQSSGDAVEQEFRESMEHRLEKGYALPGMTEILFSCQEIDQVSCPGRNCIGLCTLENVRAQLGRDRQIRYFCAVVSIRTTTALSCSSKICSTGKRKATV